MSFASSKHPLAKALLFSRQLQNRLLEALADTPVVVLNGPRQSGKTTLVRQLAGTQHRYYTLDDELTRIAAQQDPVGFVRGLDGVVIDEIQRVPSLLLAIKQSVDEDRRPGRFLLTGSANLLALPTVADSLAGRMETQVLLPLAQCEMSSHPGAAMHWLDAVFAGDMPQAHPQAQAQDLVQRVSLGGYPQALTRLEPRRRKAWSNQYIQALLARDVKDIANIDKLEHLPLLLKALAHSAGQLCNYSQLGGQVGMNHKTAEKYVTIFEHLFLLQRLLPWSSHRLSRLLKTPKLQFLDSGLLGSLLGFTGAPTQRSLFGHLLEGFVYGELRKLATWSQDDYSFYYYRDKENREVDFVIENAAGELVGVEVKAAASVSLNDLAGLKTFAQVQPGVKAGVVLYDGTLTLPLGKAGDTPLWAVPLSTLWAVRP